MKRSLFILICSVFVITIYAQTDEQKGFVFDKFEKGKVLYKKNNQATESNFNYETIIEKMLFMLPDSTVYELARPDIVSHVMIGNRIFEYIDKGIFYERVNVNNGPFYIRWKSKIVSEKDGPYGSSRGTARVDNITQMPSMGSVYDLKAAEKVKVEPNNIYYIKEKNKFRRFDSFDALAKLYKGHEQEIKGYVKENDLSFKRLDDIKKAVEYCTQFSR